MPRCMPCISVAPEMVVLRSAINQFMAQVHLVPLFDDLLNSTRAVFDDLMIASFLEPRNQNGVR